MKRIAVFAVVFFTVLSAALSQEMGRASRTDGIKAVQGEGGSWSLLVEGKPFFVKGVVWSFQPPGTNYTFSLWNENDDTIRRVIDHDAPLMLEAGINTVRLFSDIPPKWVEYLYNKYGIYTIVNYLFGRYGVTVNGRWYSVTNYFEPDIRDFILAEARGFVNRYKDVPGVLMYMFGNENNYGLYWSAGGTIQDIDRWGANSNERKARALYSLFEEAMAEAKQIDGARPVGIINGDLGHIDIISELCGSLDILGVNMYRGLRAGPGFWKQVKDNIDKPVVFGEIGCDAWNAKLNREDQYNQAVYIASQWRDIYENAYGKGYGNALGGCVFEWTDEWWKHDPDTFEGLAGHDTLPDWSEPGFAYDFVPGQRNMNEEWFGITSQGSREFTGWFTVKHPRAAFYALQHIWSVDPWELVGAPPETGSQDEDGEDGPVSGGGMTVAAHFDKLDLGAIAVRGIQDSAEWNLEWKVSNRFSLTAIQSGDEVQKALREKSLFDSFPENQWGAELRTTFQGLSDQRTTGRLEGEVTLNMRHDLFVGEPLTSKIDRLVSEGQSDRPFDVYSAAFKWSGFGAQIHGFYHSGKGPWVEEGDFFYFNSETYDLYISDIWNLKAPVGLEAKYNFGLLGNQGLSVITGPRVYLDAAPMIIVKWYQNIKQFSFSALFSQEFASYSDETGVVEQPLGKASLWFSWKPPMEDGTNFQAQLGVMAANWEKIDEVFRLSSKQKLIIEPMDIFSVKARVDYQPIQYFAAQAEFVYAGLVADTNPVVPWGGSTLLFDIGTGNRLEAKLGTTGYYGNYVLSINGLWRQPIIGPITKRENYALAETNPFRVGANRETVALEMLFAFDMEPASWIWNWNALDIEGGLLATNIAARYWIYQGPSDMGYYKQEDGTRAWYDQGFPEILGNYNIAWRVFYNPWSDLRFVNVLEFVRGSPIGGLFTDNSVGLGRESISGWSESLRVRYKRVIFSGLVFFDLWGPANDIEFNHTYPMQWKFEAAFSFKSKPSLMNSMDRVGVRWNGVIRDRYSTNAEYGRDTQELQLFFDISF